MKALVKTNNCVIFLSNIYIYIYGGGGVVDTCTCTAERYHKLNILL